MNELGGVVFDLFHTLIDPEPLYPPGFDKRAEIAAIAGVDPYGLSLFWDETYAERETTMIDLVDLFDRHCTEVGQPLHRDARNRIDHALGIAVDDAITKPDPRIVEIVADLATVVPVGVLSNCHEREVRLWHRSPLYPHVAVFGRSSRIGAMKPDRPAYEWIVRHLGIDPARSAYVGNGGSDELVGARAAGFGRIVHTNVYDRSGALVSADDQRTRAAQADVSVETLDDLRAELSAGTI